MAKNRRETKALQGNRTPPASAIADPSVTVIGFAGQSKQTPGHDARGAEGDIRAGVMGASGLGVGLSEVTGTGTGRGQVHADRHTGALMKNIIETTAAVPASRRPGRSWWAQTVDALLYPPMPSLMALAMLEALLIHEGMPLRFHLLAVASSIGLIYAVWVRR
jgi:hypothetical protein